MTVRADLVSGILPVLPDGRMLLLQRPATGTWEPPAGRLQAGETFEEGAVRELFEETGLLITPQRILATWVGERPGGELLASVTYIARTEDEEVRLSNEHPAYRWATLEEWLSLPSWWSRDNVRRVAEPLHALPRKPLPKPLQPPHTGDDRPIRANLGAGTVLVDPDGPEPRALLLRRRKPPAGLWENPGGMLQPGEDFTSCARRETLEETGLDAEPASHWWARVEPWKSPEDPELYAGVGFLARHPGGEVEIENDAHDAHEWATEAVWRSRPTWYTGGELDALWSTIKQLRA